VIWNFFNPGRWLKAGTLGLIVIMAPCLAEAVTLMWDRNPEPNVVGYRVYVGRVSRGYDSVLDTGNSTSAVIPTSPGITYFAVTAYDSEGLESDYSAEVTFIDASLNKQPTAGADSYSTAKNTTLNVLANGVLANDSDPDGEALTAALVAGPTQGSVILNVNGGFTYTPAPGYAGNDSFSYRVSDGMTNSAPATVTISIINQAPVANADSYTTSKNIGLTITTGTGLLANDTDANGDVLTASIVTAPANGTLTLNGNGSFFFAPAANYIGADSFTYRVSDGSAFSPAATVSLTILNSNAVPVTTPDTYVLAKNSPLTLPGPGVLANDFDADGTPLTAALVSGPTRGTLNLNANGGFTFTPTAGYAGNDSFTYRASDGLANSANTTVNLAITNTPPVANPNSYGTGKNIGLTVAVGSGLLANDADANGDALTASVVTPPANGTLNLNTNGSFTFTPTTGYAGVDSFTYRAGDGSAFSTATTVQIAITNTTPVANANNYTTSKNIGLTVAVGTGLLANDTDANGDTLTATVVTPPANGTLNLNANGSFFFTPAANYVGNDSFTYRASDGSAFSAAATVTLTIINSNAAPVAAPDNYALAKNIALSISGSGVLANDSDVDGTPLTATLVSGPAHGVLSLNANGRFTFTPTSGYAGADSFTYRASDGLTNSATTTVSLSITNTPPVANDNTYETSKNIGLTVAAGSGVLANDTDVNADTLTAAVVTPPAHGTLVLNANGSFKFTPTANYIGADSFTYRASDGSAFSAAATVALTVNNSNTAPATVADNYSVMKNTVLTIPAAGVLANDADVDGDAMTATLLTSPTRGTLNLNANGGFTYTPNANYAGADSFTYRAGDGITFSTATTVQLAITNTAPAGSAESYVTTKNMPLTVAAAGVLANDFDLEGDPLTAVLVTPTANGTLALNADGGFTYTPTTGFVGADSFRYRASDGITNSAIITVNLTIQPPPNIAPIAVADAYTTPQNTTLSITMGAGVLANDTDANDDALAAGLVSPTARGTLTLNLDGSFTYTPTNQFAGTDSFAYRTYDGSTNSATATVTITVLAPPNEAPVAQNESYPMIRNTTLTIAPAGVLANDTDADGNALIARLVDEPTHGTVALNTNGGFIYTPVANYTGQDSFTYQAYDGRTNSGLAAVVITINLPPNIAPVAQGDSYSTVRDTTLTVASLSGVLANDTDADGPTLTATVATPPANGSVVLAANGSFTYTPRAGFSGTDSFTYRASDGTANATAMVTIQVTVPPPVNVAPVASADTYALNKNETLTVATISGVLANDTDANGDLLQATLINNPTQGVLTFNADGSFTYRPQTNFTGVDSFGYAATDGTNVTGTIVVTLQVNEPPAQGAAPVAKADSYTTWQNTSLYIPWATGVLVNDTNAKGGKLVAALVATAQRGTVMMNWNGGFVFTPETDFVGTVQFGYKALEGTNASATALVTITVLEIPRTNEWPVAASDTYFTVQNTPLEIPATSGLLINDSDADSEGITAALITAPARGVVTLNPDGSFLYTPNAEFWGQDSFVYQATDGRDVSAPTLVAITVNGSSPSLSRCPTCFTPLNLLMAARSTAFAPAIAARDAVPTNGTCAQYDVLVFSTLSRALNALHDSAANNALSTAAECVAGEVDDELTQRQGRAAALAPSKFSASANASVASLKRSLAGVATSTDHAKRAKLLTTVLKGFAKVDKALASGDLAPTSLEGRTLIGTFTLKGQKTAGTFLFGVNTFIVVDAAGTPLKTGTYSYARTAWNMGGLNIAFDQPTLEYAEGTVATWNIIFGKVRHKFADKGLKGTFKAL
jgi:VCBS repeat-containing protein